MMYACAHKSDKDSKIFGKCKGGGEVWGALHEENREDREDRENRDDRENREAKA